MQHTHTLHSRGYDDGMNVCALTFTCTCTCTQIHDELILEGPAESAEEAFKLVKECMQNPLARPLLVALPVDGSIADNWYEGK